MISNLIVGMRKSGTSWLYENFKNDNDFVVSELTKESRYFTGDSGLTKTEYEGLFPYGEGNNVEVDASICSGKDSAQLIKSYNSDMRVVLILREPVEYLVSRYIHSIRKGEIAQKDIHSALTCNQWLCDELDYGSIVERYHWFDENGQLLITFFDSLQSNPNKFYSNVKTHLLNRAVGSGYLPRTDRVNVARSSSAGVYSRTLSNIALLARKNKFHGLVNLVKKTGMHKIFEKSVCDEDRDNLYIESEEAIRKVIPDALIEFNRLRGNYD